MLYFKMINFPVDKKLSIILPNTNRALAQVLKDASPKELEVLTQGKDLKSIMNSLLKESSQNSASNKNLLDLVKNNPTFKELGSANQSIKELLNTLKSDKSLEQVEKLLQKFLPSVKELKNIDVKATLENSGVFLESKLKDVKNPQVNLKNLLTQLSDLLQKSKLPGAKVLNIQTRELLSSALLKEATNEALTQSLKENPKELQNLAKSLQNIVDKFTTELKSANPITTKDFESKLNKLEHILEPKNLQKENFKLSSLQDSLKQVTSTLENSFTKESKSFLDALNKNFASIKSIEQNPNSIKLENITKSIQDVAQNIKTELKSSDLITSKDIALKLNKLEADIKSPQSLGESIKQLTNTLQNSSLKETGGIIDALNKIFKALQSVEQTTSPLKTILEQVVDKKIPTDIKSIVEDIKSSIKNSDPLFSKPTKDIFSELSLLKSASKLSPHENIKEILSNDLKAVLHRAGDEIVKSTVVNQSEVLKQMDKLSLQIDYYQLVSHLTNSSSLYIPFAWDEMQDGNITLKQDHKDKFYCDIELKLKEYGELKLRLTLYEKNQLNIHIDSDNEEFKNIIKENIPSLRKALIDTQITPREIRFFNRSKTTTQAYGDDSKHMNMGFEVKA